MDIREDCDPRCINEVFKANIEFEAIMDSVDFNSYLPEDANKDHIKKTPKYQVYINKLDVAEKIISNALEMAPKTDFYKQFFGAKKKRLEARKQPDRKEEKYAYIEAIKLLDDAFGKIDLKDFRENSEGDVYKKSNWAKLLLYNELSICHSGLVESSISLGYAERAISLLKEIDPNVGKPKETTPLHIIPLYTVALYNKGEAERGLHNYDQAIKTFGEILEIYENQNGLSAEKPSDYYSALIRISTILIDLGRGKEALEYLKKTEDLEPKDYRIQESQLERVSAHLDMKDYKDALPILDSYRSKDWEYTFARRKANVNMLRLVTEFIFNQSKDFETNNQYELTKRIRADDKTYVETADFLLHECVERSDSDNFKKVCTRLADHFHELNETPKSLSDIQKNWINELRYYHLYLCNKIIFEERELLQKYNKDRNEILSDWKSDKLEPIIKDYEEKYRLSEYIKKINDEKYLLGFFRTYIKIDKSISDVSPKSKEKIINELKDHLIDLLPEKDKVNEAQKIQEEYDIYKEITGESKNTCPEKKDSIKFIHDYFLKEERGAKEITCLNPNSIIMKMSQNTKEFASNVVGKTKRFPKDGEDEEFKGIFVVLRRWNSFTPTLTSSGNHSKGGGYFLYFSCDKTTLGIVIDPGYDFLENFLSLGFRIRDIDVVVISHAHPDHTDSLPSILSLFHEANGRLGKYYRDDETFNKSYLKLILSQGVFDQYYSGFIGPNKESLKDVIVVKVKTAKKKQCFEFKFDDNGKHSLSIEAFPTQHGDLMKWDSLGFIINIKNDGKPCRSIGYTSDAHWTENFSDNLKECDTICAHLGSIIDILEGKKFSSLCKNFENDVDSPGDCTKFDGCKKEKFKNRKPSLEKLKGQVHEQRHLYLSGLAMLFDDLLNKKMELAVISEFGEELKGGLRIDLYNKFNAWFKARAKNTNAKCIPGDIGLEINVMNNDILCTCCQEFKSREKTMPIAYGKEEAIFFVCEECQSVLSSYQIDQKLKEYYENGRKLELSDDSKK
ncbi:MBL fold metallo-hydrolase [Candidatus Bathyarchaeota archaeon]|nr:MBL fold metallo-hydrolase [Candidatus Bathyarchaeota archaeon]